MSYLKSSEIGQKIRILRQNAALTQEALAELVGVTFQQIQKYESGATMLNTDKLQKVAKALKVGVSSLFGENPEASQLLTDREKIILEGYRSIKDSRTRDSLHVIVSSLSKSKGK